jgi:hypothetical protein
MFAQTPIQISSDGTWIASFLFTDANGNPINLSGMQARMIFDRDGLTCDDYDWWNGSRSYLTASTTSGEIANGGATGGLVLSTKLCSGGYRVRGEIFIGPLIAPFFIGRLELGHGVSQLYITPLGNSPIPWNDGGVVAIASDATVSMAQGPMAIPNIPGSGEFWNDGGIVAVNGTPADLPTVLPTVPGQPWNNNGVISIS